MQYRIAATAVAILHGAFILFVVLGGVAVLRRPKLAWLHVPAAIWGPLIEFGGWICPLTSIENDLLQRAGRAGYAEGFVAHYIFAVIYPHGLTRGLEVAIGVLVVIVNVAVYIRVLR